MLFIMAFAVHCVDGSDQQKSNGLRMGLEKTEVLWTGTHTEEVNFKLDGKVLQHFDGRHWWSRARR